MSESEKSPEPAGERKLPGPPAGYDAIGEAKRLARGIKLGSLCTIDRATGHPIATLSTMATDYDGAPILLLSQLSAHTRNLDADPRASILLAQGGKGDPLAHPRVTLIGRAEKQGGDFAFWRLELSAAHLNGGFAKAADFSAAEFLTSLEGADDLLTAEEGALEHMNADHPAALSLYATKLAGEPEGRWRATGLDPEGIDLAAGDLTTRVAFPRRVVAPGELRDALVEMAARARAAV